MLVLALVSSAGTAAWAGEWWNTDAPGWDDPGDGSRLVLVRKQPGSVWKKTVTPCCGNWIQMTWPDWGLASGPVGAGMGSPSVNIMMGTDQGTVKHSTNGGVSWSTTFGAPLGGVASAVAVAGINGGEGNIAVILNGKPWWRRRLTNGTLLPWTQVGSINVSTAPGIAMTDWRTDIFAVRSNGTVIQTTCQYPTCFSDQSTWTDVPGKTTTFQPNAAWWTDSNGDYFLSLVIRAADGTAWEKIYNNFTGTWGNWTQRGNTQVTSSVSVAKPLSGGTAARLVARRSDGNHWVNNSGGTWTSIGKP
jgi:hypothetical protein